MGTIILVFLPRSRIASDPRFKGKRRSVRTFIDYMYSTCDIGQDVDTTQAVERQLDVVIWTDVDDHFDEVSKRDFVRAALRHIQGLTPEGKAKAAEYIWRAPDFVQTPVRTALQKKPWFTT